MKRSALPALGETAILVPPPTLRLKVPLAHLFQTCNSPPGSIRLANRLNWRLSRQIITDPINNFPNVLRHRFPRTKGRPDTGSLGHDCREGSRGIYEDGTAVDVRLVIKGGLKHWGGCDCHSSRRNRLAGTTGRRSLTVRLCVIGFPRPI